MKRFCETSLSIDKHDRAVKCRLCNEMIPKGEYSLVMRDIHISPGYKDLWFHRDCIIPSVAVAEAKHLNVWNIT